MKKLLLFTFLAIQVACFPQDPAIECYSVDQWDSLKLSHDDEMAYLRAENDTTILAIKAANDIKIDSLKNYMHDTIQFIETLAEIKMHDTIQKVFILLDEVSKQINIQGDNGTAIIQNDSSYFRLKRSPNYFNLIFSKKHDGQLDERLHLTVSDGFLELWEGKENTANLVYICKLFNFGDY